MEKESLKKKTFNGMKWALLDNIANSGVTFLVGLVLARMLSPVEFGILGIITIFINLSITVIDGGFATALIRKPDADENDYNTVFHVNVLVSGILIALLCLTSEFIANFFAQPVLAQVLPIMSIILLFNACSLIQKTILVKRLDFRSQAYVSLVSSITSGAIGITIAYHGGGIWALAVQQMSRQFIMMMGLWIANHWMPTLRFSKKSFRDLFGFGSKILAANVINSLYKDMFLAVIGKMYTIRELGYYNRADQFNIIFSNNFGQIVKRVSLSSLSLVQDDETRFRHSYRKMTLYIGMINFAAVFGLSAIAKPLIVTLIGEKWLPSVYLLQIMSLYAALYPLHQLNLNILSVRKRSDLFLKLEIVKKILFIPVIVVGFFFELQFMIWAAVVYYYVEFFVNNWYTESLIGYGSWKQIKDLCPIFFTSIGISLAVWTLTLTGLPYLLMIFLQLLIGMLLYVAVYTLTGQTEFMEIRNFCLNKVLHRR